MCENQEYDAAYRENPIDLKIVNAVAEGIKMALNRGRNRERQRVVGLINKHLRERFTDSRNPIALLEALKAQVEEERE